jgi:UDP-N-acetylmuramoyl-tripeptide--D-alanyl-D-alanine ligase
VAHIEYLGSKREFRAKLEILDGLKPGGRVVVNGDDDMLVQLKGSLAYPVTTYGIENQSCDVTASGIVSEAGGIIFRMKLGSEVFDCRINAAGRHNVYNALAAAAAGSALGLNAGEIKRGIEAYSPDGLRQNFFTYRGINSYRRCLQRQSDSMRAALEVLGGIEAAGRRIAVLGGMLELGRLSVSAHEQVGELAASGADMLFAFGGDSRLYLTGWERGGMPAEQAVLFESRERLAERLGEELKPGDTVRFKGSFGMR